MDRVLGQLVPTHEWCRVARTELYVVVVTVFLLAQRGLHLPQHPENDA